MDGAVRVWTRRLPFPAFETTPFARMDSVKLEFAPAGMDDPEIVKGPPTAPEFSVDPVPFRKESTTFEERFPRPSWMEGGDTGALELLTKVTVSLITA